MDQSTSYIPGPNVPKRSPQLLRDRKPSRPGVPETVEKVPLSIAIPLLVGKAHSELYEVAREPNNAEEYGDVCEVLMALAEACGHDWVQVETKAADIEPGSAFIEDASFRELAYQLHSKFEDIALDLENIDHFAEALELLWTLAEASGVEWEEVEILAEDKRDRLGGFSEHMFWSPILEL